MRIAINPMDQLVKKAERRVNFFKGASSQDLAHDRKRQLAQAVADGAEPTAEFARAAALEGRTARELATTILAKPDVLMRSENERRALVLKVRAAKSAPEIEQILADHGIGRHPDDRLPGLI